MNKESAKINSDLLSISDFLSNSQMKILKSEGVQDGSEFFKSVISRLKSIINDMPVTFQQDGLGDDAVAHLHYFYGGSDWYITDMEGGIERAFGFARLNGDSDNAELGYISIKELTSHNVELDFHFEPTTLCKIKEEMGISSTDSDMDI